MVGFTTNKIDRWMDGVVQCHVVRSSSQFALACSRGLACHRPGTCQLYMVATSKLDVWLVGSFRHPWAASRALPGGGRLQIKSNKLSERCVCRHGATEHDTG